MALATIQTILDTFPGWTTDFDLIARDEISRTANGVTLVKEMGSPLWQMSVTSRTLNPSELRHWRARLNSLDNGKGLFYGYDLNGCYPITYPNGTWPTGSSFSGTSAQISSINANNKLIAISSLPAAFKFVVGDYISFDYGANTNRALHQVMENITANGSGVTGQFEVRPYIRTGATVGAAVRVFRPSTKMMLIPGSLSSTAEVASGWGILSFSAVQVIQ